MEKYSLGKGLVKSLINIGIIAIPFLITTFPDVANLTIGALGLMLLNYIKQIRKV